MQFLFPGFLWALAALAIPVILHLFYFRRYKKVYFSNVRFLREVKEETSARNKLRNLLILLMRCLALAFLVFAFAQPFIPVSGDVYQGSKNVSLFIDNSFSMQSFGQDLPLLDRARQKGREILDAYSEEDQFQILTHDLSVAQQRYLSKEEAIAELEEIDITADVVSFSRAVTRQQQLAASDDPEKFAGYYISDFQKATTDIDTADRIANYHLIPVQSVQEKNITVDSAWFDAPAQMLNQTSAMVIRITNFSSDDVENVKLTVSVDGQEKPLGALDIAAGETVHDTANITILKTGWHQVIVRITDFPVQFDDTYYATFYVDEDMHILSINGSQPNPRLVAAFANNPHYQLDDQNVAQLNYSSMGTYDLIILNEVVQISSGFAEELHGYISDGGKVLFFPAPGAAPEGYNDFLSRCGANTFTGYEEQERLVGYINTQEFLFSDVYINTQRNLRLPATQANYTSTTLQGRTGERILGYRDGSSFLEKYVIDRGYLLVCSAPLSNEISDLSKNAEIFIPLLYKAAIVESSNRPLAYTIGQPAVIEVDAVDNTGDRVVTFSGAREFIPAITPLGSRMLLDPGDQVREAGFYDLVAEEEVIGVYAFNYDRTESDLSYYTVDELDSRYGAAFEIWPAVARASLTEQITQRERGITLWRWCIILALAFLALEILLIRLWKS